MKYIIYYDGSEGNIHIKEIDESKINILCSDCFTYEGKAYRGPLYDTKEEAKETRLIRFSSKEIIED